jgi:hypothetical protein
MQTDLLTDADLAEIEARANAATPGPWWPWPDAEGWFVRSDTLAVTTGMTEADADFIRASRTDIPRLLADRRALLLTLAKIDAWTTKPNNAPADWAEKAIAQIGRLVEAADAHA